jgi:AraC-like DNA-binding protein
VGVEPLTDILRSLRLTGTVYFQADFGAPWGMSLRGGELANFHIVVRGRCWVRPAPTADAIPLEEGDLVVFPHGDSHDLLNDVGAEVVPAQRLVGIEGRQGESERRAAGPYGGRGERTTLICGHFEYDQRVAHPLFAALPPMIHLRAPSTSPWVRTAAGLTAQEASAGQPGSGAIVDRLAEVLLMQILRAHVETLDDPATFLASLTDPAVAGALAEIHAAPEAQWTLASLARTVGMSRSGFAEHFKSRCGLSPMSYLTQWRMLRGRELLWTTSLTMAEVAARVGYHSEFAFAKAFKRTFGEAPGAVRREGSSAGMGPWLQSRST